MVSKSYKLLISLFLVVIISSCGPFWYKPYGRIFTHMPKGGTPGFQLGWRHGCESGLGTQFGNGFYMFFYTWKRDPDISSVNPDVEKIRKRYRKELAEVNWTNTNEIKKNFSDYNIIFWSAHAYCRHSVLGELQMGGVEPPLPDTPRFTPGEYNLGTIYKIDGKGDARWNLW